MPWSPLQFTPQIFERLQRWGYSNEVSPEFLFKAVMMETKLIRHDTIKKVLVAFCDLGYIEKQQNGMFKILYWELKSDDRI